jgi:putative ABC transport system permease protein
VAKLASRIPWEAIALLLAAIALYEIWRRGSVLVEAAGGGRRADPVALAFPIMLMAGIAGILSRGLSGVLTRRRGAIAKSPAAFLASRRLAASARPARLVVSGLVFGVAILSYGWVIDASLSATAEAKALVFTGSDVAATLSGQAAVPVISQPFTAVERFEGNATLWPSSIPVDVLGIDPATFADAAFWDESFAPVSLTELLRLLERAGDGNLPAVGVAPGPGGSSGLVLGDDRIPVDVVAGARAFPGLRLGRPLVVVDRRGLDAALAAAGTSPAAVGASQEVWIRGDASRIVDALSDVPVRLVTASEVRQSGGFLALSWTFGLLRALGILTFGVAMAGILVYLGMVQRRRQVADALMRRMGLSPVDARRAAAFEVGALLVSATAIGVVLAVCTSLFMYGLLDPLPTIPPPPVFRLPALRLILLALMAITSSVIAGRLLDWAARRGKIGELVRYAQ